MTAPARDESGALPSRRLRILIVSHFFPPLSSIGSQRPYGWARRWADLGHHVQVLTTEKLAHDGSLDMALDLDGIRVETVPYVRGLPRATGQTGPISRSARWERLKRHTRGVRRGLGMFADLRLLAWRPLLRRARALHDHTRFDFVISTYEPALSHLVASALARDTALPWIADYRDLWHVDVLGLTFPLAARASAAIERRTVSRATLISTVSQGLAVELGRHCPRPVFVSYNGYLEGGPSPPAPPATDELRLVHTGRFYETGRNPEPLLRALALLRDRAPERAARVRVDLYGAVDPWLVASVRRHRVEDLVHLRGPVPFFESLAAQKRATALLFFDWTGDDLEGVVSGKLFEYLGSGRPIVFVGSRADSEAAGIVDACGAGARIGSAEALADWLISTDPRALDHWRPAADAVAFFSRRHQAERLLSRIAREIHIS